MVFYINRCYNLKLRVEGHHEAHSCGHRPSIIIWMGSIYIHMYKTYNFIYIILPSSSTVQRRILGCQNPDSITAVCQPEQRDPMRPQRRDDLTFTAWIKLSCSLNNMESFGRPVMTSFRLQLTGSLRKQKTHCRVSDDF